MKELISIALTLGLIVAVTLFLNVLDKPDEPQEAIAVPDKNRPDIRVNKITMLKTDDFGYHKFHLQAERVLHFLGKSTELEKLSLLVTSSETSDWLISAESGWMDSDKKQLLLQGEVLVHQKTEEKADITGITRDMIVDYANSLAYSPSAATLLNGQTMTSGTGLAIKFSNPSRINLLSRVSGIHVFE